MHPTRLLRGDIDKAMQMSFPIWRISNAAKSSQLLFNGFPMLAYGALLRKQLIEFGNILTEMSYMTDLNNSEKYWYHGLSLVLNLETGYIVESVLKCNQFLQDSCSMTLADPMDRKRLIICRWLWEVRNENWEAAMMWQKSAWNFNILEKGEKLYNLLICMYLLEGVIIFMVSKMDMKDYKAANKAERFINLLFNKIEKVSKINPILQPRLLHMKAYYTMAFHNDFKLTIKYLKQAHKIAEKQHNDLEASWVRHSEMVWSNKLSPEEKYAWQERCEESNCVQLNDVDFADRISHYSLPLPVYI